MQAANKAVLEAEDIVAGHYRRFLNALTVFRLCLAAQKKKAEKAAAKEGGTDAENTESWDAEAWEAWESEGSRSAKRARHT
ncbi:unnamed protein product [Symbiodinium necroappetens]|uniref:Uncharacterized protein n=1 Tax=Symbiodinium necroappetens TaxID=1628268 RepID=A0A813A662_9DINO|nr:unnamed protein product [Symbiodinium necroappetens]